MIDPQRRAELMRMCDSVAQTFDLHPESTISQIARALRQMLAELGEKPKTLAERFEDAAAQPLSYADMIRLSVDPSLSTDRVGEKDAHRDFREMMAAAKPPEGE